jgi:hypothetical protein
MWQELASFEQANFVQVTVQMESRSRASQPVDARVNHEALASPGCDQSARDLVLFEDARLIAVQLSIYSCTKPGYSCTNYDDGLL